MRHHALAGLNDLREEIYFKKFGLNSLAGFATRELMVAPNYSSGG